MASARTPLVEMANLPLVMELCRTSERLQSAYAQVNSAEAETDALRRCLESTSLRLAEANVALEKSESRVRDLQGERDVLNLLMTSFQCSSALYSTTKALQSDDVASHCANTHKQRVLDQEEEVGEDDDKEEGLYKP